MPRGQGTASSESLGQAHPAGIGRSAQQDWASSVVAFHGQGLGASFWVTWALYRHFSRKLQSDR